MSLNNGSCVLTFCELTGVPNMLKPHLVSAFSLLLCLSALPYAKSAQRSETRIVPVTTVTADGKPVTNLQSRNVRIQDRDVQIKTLSLDTNPRRIVLLIDTSGSMGMSNGRVTLLQAAVHTARLFLDRVPSADLISVHAFADTDREVVPFIHDAGAIRAGITDLLKPDAEGAKKEHHADTDLRGALNSILTLLSDHPQFGDSIVIFSDGLFPRSDQDDILSYYDQPDYLERALPRLGGLGVRVFFSLAGKVQGTPPLHGIELFMGGTGGESFEFHDSGPSFYGAINAYDRPATPVFRSDSLEQRAAALCVAIQDTYRLQLELAASLEKPTRLRLDFVDDRGKALRDVVVLTPKFLYPDSTVSP